jgi:trehalose-phosphatase
MILGFVSGRPISDISNHIGLRKVFYIGNHGLEFKRPNDDRIKILSKTKIDKSLKAIRNIARQLKEETKSLKGVWLEDKKYSISLHYRQANYKDAKIAAKVFNQIIAPAEKDKKIRVTRGKKVFEIRPSFNQNKGTAVEKIKKILSKKSPLLIYLGDDVTDEDVFRLMSKKDISIHIGKGDKSAAQYSLKNVKAVGEFLKKVYRIRSGKIDA